MPFATHTLLDRFLRYVRIDTQADDKSEAYPSSPGQLVLVAFPCLGGPALLLGRVLGPPYPIGERVCVQVGPYHVWYYAWEVMWAGEEERVV